LALQRAPWLFDARAPQISRAKPRPQTQRTKPARLGVVVPVHVPPCAVPHVRSRAGQDILVVVGISNKSHTVATRGAQTAIVPGKSEWRGSRLAHREATGALSSACGALVGHLSESECIWSRSPACAPLRGRARDPARRRFCVRGTRSLAVSKTTRNVESGSNRCAQQRLDRRLEIPEEPGAERRAEGNLRVEEG